MFWSAASVTLAVLTPGQDRLSGRDRAVWRRLEPAIATLFVGDQPLGPAALIDGSGLFVAHAGAVSGETVNARLGGKPLRMVVVSRERNTELVLLKAEGYEGSARPFRAPAGDVPAGSLFAVLSTGPIPADHVPTRRYGVLGSTKRGVPLSEIRFEAPAVQFGTGLLLTESGELFGTVKAALARTDAVTGNLRGGGATPIIQRHNLSAYGPSALTVAYAVGPQVVRRVIDGFLSPSREVVFPAIGIFCVDAVGGGALIHSVTQGSPAAAAGIQASDILLDLGGSSIRDQLDFARVMLRQEVGRKVPVRLRRGGLIQVRDVVIGRAEQ